MLSHTAIGLAPVAAIALFFAEHRISFAAFTPPLWTYLYTGIIVLALLAAIPTTLTGVFERNRKYGAWLDTQKIKLGFSLFLLVLLSVETAELLRPGTLPGGRGLFSPFGLLVVVGNNLAVFVLSYLGLRIVFGRQSFKGASFSRKERQEQDALERARESVRKPKIKLGWMFPPDEARTRDT